MKHTPYCDLGYMIMASDGWLVAQLEHWKWMGKAMREAHKILDDNVIQVPISRLGNDGKGSPPWLTAFVVGDVLLTRRHHGVTLWYDEVTIHETVDNKYYLLSFKGHDVSFTAWADAFVFSEQHKLTKVLIKKE